MKEEIKQIWQCENGEVEFKNQEELERYFRGEKPQLESQENGRYKAIFNT